MLNNVLSKNFIIQNGYEFEKYLGYGGPYDLGIVEYTDEHNEKLFTGLAYDLYKNGNIESYFYVENGVKQGKYVEFYSSGNVKKMGNMNKNSAEGYQVEFFENGSKKYESECVAGLEITYRKYDENEKIIEQKTAPSESDLSYVKKFSEKPKG